MESDYLKQAKVFPETHQLMLLEVGDDALLARLHLIRAATETIDIQTFIWKEDEVTRVIYQELLHAARRGVKVRVLVDALNPISGNTQLARMAVAHRNLEFAVFRPVSNRTQPDPVNKLESMILKMRRLNRRMHNKLLLVDQSAGIIGGRNFENKYFDRNPEMIFKDRDALVIGPSTTEMYKMFEAFWEHRDSVYLTQFKDVQQRLPLPLEPDYSFVQEGDLEFMEEIYQLAGLPDPGIHRPEMRFYEVEKAVFFWDPPEKFLRGKKKYHNLYGEVLGEVLETANERIIFQSPYLIYQRKSKKRVRKVRENNPNLAIWFSSNSLAAADHDLVYGVSFKDRKKLYKGMGIEIFEFKPYPKDLLEFVPRYPELCGMSAEAIQRDLDRGIGLRLFTCGPKLTIHSKTFVVDELYTQIGSHNFDPRSSSLNTECGLIVKDRDFTRRVTSLLLRELGADNSWMVAKKDEKESMVSRMSGFMGAISNMLPVFDIWPYTYTSNFELREGFAPLPSSRHPDFYKHYRDVGQFPMAEKAMERIRAKFMKAFGGWTSPFM